LAEGLPNLVYGGATEYEMQCPELPVSMNEYFGPKHKIQVPYHSKVRVESFAVYNERTQQVNTGENKTIISKQKRK